MVKCWLKIVFGVEVRRGEGEKLEGFIGLIN